MANEQVEQLEARLLVLERLVVMLIGERYVDAAKAGKPGIEMAARDARTWCANIARAEFPDIDPALADHRAAEAEQHAQELLGAMLEHVRMRLA